MEGPHWFFMVCPGSTTKDQIIHQTWSEDCEEGANFKSNSNFADFIDNVDRNEHWIARSSSSRISPPANMLVYTKINVMPNYVHLCILDLFEDFLGLLHRNVFTLNSALIFTVVLKTFINFSFKRSQCHSVICGTYSSSLGATFLFYMVFLIVKMIYPAMNLIPWLVPAGNILLLVLYYST